MIDIDLAEKARAPVFANFRTRMLAIPARAAPQVVTEDVAGAHALLAELIEEALRELSTNELRAVGCAKWPRQTQDCGSVHLLAPSSSSRREAIVTSGIS